MKIHHTLFLVVLSGSVIAAPSNAPTDRPSVPIYPAAPAPAQPAKQQPNGDEQKLWQQAQPALITPEQAQGIIDKFKPVYVSLGSPRLLLYVNRDLVDQKTGMKLIARNEKTETLRTTTDSAFEAPPGAAPAAGVPPLKVTAAGNVTVNGNFQSIPGKGSNSTRQDKVVNENRYKNSDREETLADRQTLRDVEKLFGRPLRSAGASLADQRVATQLLADRPLESFTVPTETEAARKDREALSKIADVVLEVLISSKNVTVAELSGDKVYSVPDIQATAIRLKDSKIIGQASSTDVIGKDRDAGRIARYFDVHDIAEATALALMEDIATHSK